MAATAEPAALVPEAAATLPVDPATPAGRATLPVDRATPLAPATPVETAAVETTPVPVDPEILAPAALTVQAPAAVWAQQARQA